MAKQNTLKYAFLQYLNIKCVNVFTFMGNVRWQWLLLSNVGSWDTIRILRHGFERTSKLFCGYHEECYSISRITTMRRSSKPYLRLPGCTRGYQTGTRDCASAAAVGLQYDRATWVCTPELTGLIYRTGEIENNRKLAKKKQKETDKHEEIQEHDRKKSSTSIINRAPVFSRQIFLNVLEVVTCKIQHFYNIFTSTA